MNENQEFKASLSYTASSRPIYVTEFLFKNTRIKGKEEGKKGKRKRERRKERERKKKTEGKEGRRKQKSTWTGWEAGIVQKNFN